MARTASRVMANERLLPMPTGHLPIPKARRISHKDVRDALAEGWTDFRRAPGYGLFVGAVYAFLGAGGLSLCLWLGWGQLVFPALSGFLLIGPFAALGLYEISREAQTGQTFKAREIFFAFKRHGGKQIALFGFFLVLVTIFWMKAATFIYAVYFGLSPAPIEDLLLTVTTSWLGVKFAITGVAVGAFFAALIFCTSVFAVPLLLDKDVDVVTATIASVGAVRANLRPMMLWGCMVTGMVGLGLVTGLIGLILVMPIVGHATWRLYVRVLQEPSAA